VVRRSSDTRHDVDKSFGSIARRTTTPLGTYCDRTQSIDRDLSENVSPARGDICDDRYVYGLLAEVATRRENGKTRARADDVDGLTRGLAVNYFRRFRTYYYIVISYTVSIGGHAPAAINLCPRVKKPF
jgi:hypothetical protein